MGSWEARIFRSPGALDAVTTQFLWLGKGIRGWGCIQSPSTPNCPPTHALACSLLLEHCSMFSGNTYSLQSLMHSRCTHQWWCLWRGPAQGSIYVPCPQVHRKPPECSLSSCGRAHQSSHSVQEGGAACKHWGIAEPPTRAIASFPTHFKWRLPNCACLALWQDYSCGHAGWIGKKDHQWPQAKDFKSGRFSSTLYSILSCWCNRNRQWAVDFCWCPLGCIPHMIISASDNNDESSPGGSGWNGGIGPVGIVLESLHFHTNSTTWQTPVRHLFKTLRVAWGDKTSWQAADPYCAMLE